MKPRIQGDNGVGETAKPHRTFGTFGLLLLSVLVGIVAGLGAVAFRALIAFFHNLLFLGKISCSYNANAHTPASPWGPFVILVPVLGAMAVSFLVRNFALEAKGHGVPEVMDAIFYNRGMIRPVVALIKSLASAISIGTGGSVGREGPIVQIGSSFGSTLGQWIPMPAWQRVTLISAGAGAGIAATFNTLVGGIFFAMEIMMHEISVRTLVPVAMATAAGTYLGRLFFGSHPAFAIPAMETPYFRLIDPAVLVSYVGLGVLCGIASALFIRSVYWMEDFFEQRIGGSYYRQHVLGMSLIGILLYLLWVTTGHYYIQGVGYATVQDILTGSLSAIPFLLLLFALKLLATSLTLGSGASGGIFSPSLFMGATLGGAYGVVVKMLFPDLAVDPPAFAVAGMAGLVGGSTGAAMAAIVMIFEMTLDYTVIIPMTITVALSYSIRPLLCRQTIYTMKLARRGHSIPPALQASLYQVRCARDIMETRLGRIQASETLATLAQEVQEQENLCCFLVEQDAKVVGVLMKDTALETLIRSGEDIPVAKIMIRKFIRISPRLTFYEITALMGQRHVSIALVGPREGALAAQKVQGLVTQEALARALVETTEMFLH